MLVSIDIALFDEVVRVKVLFPVPPVTVIVSESALPTVAGTVYPRVFVRVMAGLTVTVNTATVTDPTASVQVMVSVVVPATTPVAATLSTAMPEEALDVSRVIPDCAKELVLTKVLVPDPPETVMVSEAVLPNVVVRVGLLRVFVGNSLIVNVTTKVPTAFVESVAVKV